MSSEKIDRNRFIFQKFKQGASKSELAQEYGLSEARIYQIIEHERYYQNHPHPDIPEIATACKVLGATDWMNSRIQTPLRLKKLGINNQWRKLTRDDILKIWGLGEKAADIIEYAQKL